MNTLQNRIRGSLIGGAIVDALGYPVEFIYSFEEIHVIDCRYFNRNMIDYVKGNKITDILLANNMGHASNSATWEMYLKYLEQ